MIIPLIIVTLLFGAVALAIGACVFGKPATSTHGDRGSRTSAPARSRSTTRFGRTSRSPFVDRVLKPGVEGIAQRVERECLPQSVLSDIQKKLMMAGNPMKFNTFVTFWAVLLGHLASAWA